MCSSLFSSAQQELLLNVIAISEKFGIGHWLTAYDLWRTRSTLKEVIKLIIYTHDHCKYAWVGYECEA